MMTIDKDNNIADKDAIALLSEQLRLLTEKLHESEKDNKRLKRMVQALNQRVAFTSNLADVYARMLETKTLE